MAELKAGAGQLAVHEALAQLRLFHGPGVKRRPPGRQDVKVA